MLEPRVRDFCRPACRYLCRERSDEILDTEGPRIILLRFYGSLTCARCHLFPFTLSLLPPACRYAKAAQSRLVARSTTRHNSVARPPGNCHGVSRRGQPLACGRLTRSSPDNAAGGQIRSARGWADDPIGSRTMAGTRVFLTARRRPQTTVVPLRQVAISTRRPAVRIPRFLRRADTRSTPPPDEEPPTTATHLRLSSVRARRSTSRPVYPDNSRARRVGRSHRVRESLIVGFHQARTRSR